MRAVGLVLLLVAIAGLLATTSLGARPKKAPDFAGGGPWFNTGGTALTIDGLRGRMVGVEMWTAG